MGKKENINNRGGGERESTLKGKGSTGNYHLWTVRCNRSWTGPNTVITQYLCSSMILQTCSAVFFFWSEQMPDG